MNRISNISAVFGLTALLILALTGCAEDVGSGETRCGAGEMAHPITAECMAIECGPGEQLNPVTEVCEPGSSTNGGHNSTNGSNGSTTNQSTNGTNNGNNGANNQDPDCPFNQECNDDNGGNVTNPNPNYDPFQPQDPATAEYHSCESSDFDGIPAPQFVLSTGGNYLLAINPNAQASLVGFPSNSPRAHFIEDADDGYAAFVMAIPPRTAHNDAQDVADWLFDEVADISGYQAVREGDGQSYRAHDNYRASILNHVSIDTTDAPGVVRDRLVGRLYGMDPSTFSYDLPDTVDADGSGIHLTYKTVWRSEAQVIIVGGITTTSRQDQHDGAARFAIQDLAGGTALALAGETMTDECVSLELTDTTEVDIIVSLDASGSMSDVQDSLMGFADELVSILDSTDVDWRVAVTGVDCHNIRDDDDLSPEFRDLWPDPDDWDGANFPFPFPGMEDMDTPCRNPSMIGFGDDNNGRLMGNGFTTSAQEISNQMGMVSTAGLEYTLTMGIAAIDHSLPRTANNAFRIRPNAAVVVIVVTDENEQLFKDAFSWISGSNQSPSTAQMAELAEFAEPWIGYLQRPDVGATVYGLYWVPGTTCDGGIDVAHGIHHVVEQTGGTGDSICSPDINQSFANIAYATQDLTTGLRLLGDPLASSITVDVEDLNDPTIVEPLPRSVADGFDFDPTQNSLYFEGPNTPDIGQRIIVPYLQWNRTIIPCSSDNICPGAQKCVNGICQ